MTVKAIWQGEKSLNTLQDAKCSEATTGFGAIDATAVIESLVAVRRSIALQNSESAAANTQVRHRGILRESVYPKGLGSASIVWP